MASGLVELKKDAPGFAGFVTKKILKIRLTVMWLKILADDEITEQVKNDTTMGEEEGTGDDSERNWPTNDEALGLIYSSRRQAMGCLLYTSRCV